MRSNGLVTVKKYITVEIQAIYNKLKTINHSLCIMEEQGVDDEDQGVDGDDDLVLHDGVHAPVVDTNTHPPARSEHGQFSAPSWSNHHSFPVSFYHLYTIFSISSTTYNIININKSALVLVN